MHFPYPLGLLFISLHHIYYPLLLLLLLEASLFLSGTANAGIITRSSSSPSPIETLDSSLVMPGGGGGGGDDDDDDHDDDSHDRDPWEYTNTTDPFHAVLVNGSHTYEGDDDEMRLALSSMERGALNDGRIPAPNGWDRMCIRDGEFNTHVQVYIREWGATPFECGKGLLDNIRGECRCIVHKWRCYRVNTGDKGVWAHFSLTSGPGVRAGAVERAFVLASAHEYIPQSLKCCALRDHMCTAQAPGWIGHVNLTDPAPPERKKPPVDMPFE